MKKAVFLFSAFLLFVIWIGEHRSFYCVGNDECITVWKRIGGICFIIPGKYYGIFKPSGTYIQTSNDNSLIVLYFITKFPKTIIIWGDSYKIIKASKNVYTFIDFRKQEGKFKRIIYGPGAKKIGDLKKGVYILGLDIFGNLAFDKNGKEL